MRRRVVWLAWIPCVASIALGGGFKTDREREGLVGPVHTVTCEPAPGLHRWGTCPFLKATYDRGGWLLEQVYPNPNGSPSSRSVYRRDAATGRTEVTNVDGAGKPTGTKMIIRFDAARGEVVSETLDAEGVAGREVQKYDRRGNLIEEKSFYWDGSIRHESHFTHDEQGRIIKAFEYDPHGPEITTVVFSYDKTGQVAEETVYDEEGTLRGVNRNTYTLDGHGNWVQRSTRSCEPSREKRSELVCGAPRTETRRITYYNDPR
jgi:antitoxin component YwqK of YwqJK toxin-antitoxin module